MTPDEIQNLNPALLGSKQCGRFPRTSEAIRLSKNPLVDAEDVQKLESELQIAERRLEAALAEIMKRASERNRALILINDMLAPYSTTDATITGERVEAWRAERDKIEKCTAEEK